MVLLACGSSHDREQPSPTYRPGPAPNHPRMLAFANGEKYDLRPSDDVFERNIPDLAQHATVGGVIAIVPQHEIMPFWHLIDRRVVVKAIIHQAEGCVAHAVRQCLPPTLNSGDTRPFLGLYKVLDALAAHRLSVDVKNAVDHLDAIARKPDNPLDVVG